MKKAAIHILTLGTCLLLQCSPGLSVLQFQDVERIKLVKSRAAFTMDLDLTPILEAENAQPPQILTIKSHGKTYVTAKGFKNLYAVVPKSAKASSFCVVKLTRDEVAPFNEVKFQWAENETVTFKWKDKNGSHANTIDKKGKAR